jgi:hypothetical protein
MKINCPSLILKFFGESPDNLGGAYSKNYFEIPR